MAVINLLALEAPILERLKLQLAHLDVNIASIATFAGRMEITEKMPALWVQPGDAKRADARGGATATATVDVQQWVVFHLFQLLPDKKFQDTTFADPGTVLAAVYTALVGWSPGVGMGPMRYLQRPQPQIQRGQGIAEIPIVFECDVLLRT